MMMFLCQVQEVTGQLLLNNMYLKIKQSKRLHALFILLDKVFYVIERLIRIYTPFICALTAIIHGVLFLLEYRGLLYNTLNEFTGHSILLIAYILSASRRMCKWYKITNCILLSIHVINILYIHNYIEIDQFHLFIILWVMNIIALITFLIYRVSVGITKLLC